MGTGERSSAETEADDLSSRQEKDCCGSAGEVGEDQSKEEEIDRGITRN
jgi:hypothetical protein